MKESMGNAFIYGIFVAFAVLTLLILNFAINYSRASKIKNRLVNYVQTYAENGVESGFVGASIFNDEFDKEVESLLSQAGYRQQTGLNPYSNSCNLTGAEAVRHNSNVYDYCIYAYPTSRGYFYRIVTYMYFEIPIIGNVLKFPISGETKTIYNLGNR